MVKILLLISVFRGIIIAITGIALTLAIHIALSKKDHLRIYCWLRDYDRGGSFIFSVLLTIVRFMIPAFFAPDQLKLFIGLSIFGIAPILLAALELRKVKESGRHETFQREFGERFTEESLLNIRFTIFAIVFLSVVRGISLSQGNTTQADQYASIMIIWAVAITFFLLFASLIIWVIMGGPSKLWSKIKKRVASKMSTGNALPQSI